MSTLSKLKTGGALSDPESHFESPLALAQEVGLTRGQRIAALERWSQTVEQRLSSADEGMVASDQDLSGAANEPIDDDAALLQALDEARRALEAETSHGK